MRAAMEIGTAIPKLCATDMLDSFGSCRLCLIEIEGRNGTPASCTTPVAPGISVKTQTPRLKAIRKGVMELYISDHPLDCLTCEVNGELRAADRGRESRHPQRALPGGREPSRPQEGPLASLHDFGPLEVHQLLPLRARVRRSAGAVRALDASAAVSMRASSRRHGRHVLRTRPACRAARARRPARHPRFRTSSNRNPSRRRKDAHDLHLLRRRLQSGRRHESATRFCPSRRRSMPK